MAIEGDQGEDLTVICAWCSKLLHLGKGPVSHGICKACHKENFPDAPYEGVEACQAQAVARG